MNKIFGPYFRALGEDKWHWQKSCINFPAGDNVQSMLSSQKLDTEKMCELCREIERMTLQEGTSGPVDLIK